MKPLAVAALIGLCAPCVLADSLPPQTVTKVGTAAPSAVTVQGNTSGIPFHTICDSGCGGASSFLDLAGFTAGTTAINVSGGVFDDTLTAVVAGKAAAPRMTSKRALHFNLRDNSGNEIPFPAALAASGGMKVDVQNASLAVTGTFWQTTQPVSGTVTANISGSISNTTFASTQGTSPWVTSDNHTTAAAPLSLRLSDGAAFYDARSIRALTVADIVGLGAGSAIVGKIGIDQTTPGTTNLVSAGQNGTWTVQPGNTANTTPWLVAGNQTPATAFANPTNAVNANGLLSGWNGATWDRLASAGNNNDTEAVATTGVLDVESHEMVFNGTTWDRMRGNTTAPFIQGPTATNTAITQNPVLVGGETIAAGSNPTAATTGNQRRALYTLEGVAITQEGSSNRFSCFLQAITVTTQCQAAPAAGLRAYITGAHFSNQAATVQTLDVVYGTGAACVTGTTALTHKWQMGTNATTTSPQSIDANFQTPLVPVAANAICVRPSAATAFGVTLTGYVAP